MRNVESIKKRIYKILIAIGVNPNDNDFQELLNEGIESKDVLTYKQIEKKLLELAQLNNYNDRLI